MLKKLAIAAAFVVLFLTALLLPALFRDQPRPLVGPDLSSLTFSEVGFNNGDLRLAGMLFIPKGDGPFPAGVIIHGSGTSQRSNKWYLSIAKHLQESGIAVLLPDKRGSERSEGSWIGADFETLAGDTLAAVRYIRNQEFFTPSAIGLIGMSQGGWIAPVAASRENDLDFIASISGAVVAASRQLVYEESHNISHFTWPFVARLLAPITARRLQKMPHIKPYADFDPVLYWKKVSAPVFFAYGEGDENVPVDASIEVLKENLNIDFIKVYPDGGHAIRDRDTGQVQVEFLDDLVKFIKQPQKS